jgi:hypothetical protein
MRRYLPQRLDVGRPAEGNDEIDRTATVHLVGDVDAVGGPCVAGLRGHDLQEAMPRQGLSLSLSAAPIWETRRSRPA